MKKLIFIFPILFFLLNQFLELNAQELVLNSSVTGVCYGSNKINLVSIPPPKDFYKKRGTKGIASVTIYYSSGFTNAAYQAMEYAASILETIIPPDTKLTIQAYWDAISNENMLGQSVITGYSVGWGIDALNPFAFYPVSLAEKIAGKSLNADIEGDIQLTINSSINWYLGTDAKPPVQKYDLITVVLHEICHGLGFFDSMDTNGTTGIYGIGSLPMIYDTFIENSDGLRLTDTLFTNPSASLYSQLTGSQLYFNGPLLKNFTSGSRAKIYAPSTFDKGSSISHLEEKKSLFLDELGTLQVNALMTPAIGLGEAIHDPGKLTMSILGDLGWVNTRIIHNKLKDTEVPLNEIELAVTINSDTEYNRNKVGLVYSFDNFVSSNSIYLTSVNSDNNFKTILPVPSYNSELKYYFFAEDKFLRLYNSPSLAKLAPYHVYIGTDTVKPVISHTPVDYYFEKIDSVKFIATATDNIGIDTVYVEYNINNGPSKYIGLASKSLDIYSMTFNIKPEALKGGDVINYKIIAVDKSSGHNISMLPKNGYYSIKIEALKSILNGYSTDFSTAAADFFNKGFEISKHNDFSNYALHSEHPYKSPEDNDSSYNFTAILLHPVIFDASGMIISFSELVLVEPGETGSLFGSPGFYDYVILEASKNFGKTWFKLLDGYDSRYIPSWETAYNSYLDAQGNSTYIGKESMMLNRTIFPRESDNMSHGDTLLIRFRLFSDPFANGWGWVIENLKINQLVDRVEKISVNPVKVYPNPGNGLITILSNEFQSAKPVRFSVFNSAGICILNDYISGAPAATIDISSLPSGFYIIKLYFGDGIRNIRYSLIK